MAIEAKLSNDTSGVLIAGDQRHRSGQTLLQDAARSSDLLSLTVLARIPGSGKLVPLIDPYQILTAAQMVCGANGGNLAAWQAVSDGEFKINTDGTLHSITGVNTSGIAALGDIIAILQTACNGLFNVSYDVAGDTFIFTSLLTGAASTATVLTAGAAGTDISGSGFLNGLTGTGAVAVAIGGTGANTPAGLLWGNDVTSASLVSGDVTDKNILVGKSVEIDESKIVFENGVTLDTVVAETGETIRAMLSAQGIDARPTEYFQNIQPIA